MVISTASALRKLYGLWDSYGLGISWPDLRERVNSLIDAKVAPIKWLPETWGADVAQLRANAPGDIFRPAPTLQIDGVTQLDKSMVPDWLDTAEKAAWWNELSAIVNNAVNSYAMGKLEEGRQIIADAEADAAFWDRAYNFAVSIRDFVPNIAANAWAGLGGKWKTILIVGVFGVVGYFALVAYRAYKGK